MRAALAEARRARSRGEVPVGAVVAFEGVIVGRAGNASIGTGDPTAHAEVVALRRAARRVGNHRLTGATVVVTLEPCVMCMGALAQARVARLVFAARDPKAGAAVSLYRLAEDPRLNHRFEVTADVEAAAAADLLRAFFRARRGPRSRGRASSAR